jgi:hypothetical protein
VVISIISMIQGSIVAAANPPPAPDLTSNPLIVLLIGSIIGSISPLLVVYITNKQQLKRDQTSHKMQLAREKEANTRFLKEAKRERLRNYFKALLNTADTYQVEVQQMNHVPNSAIVLLTGEDEVMNEIALEGVGSDVL